MEGKQTNWRAKKLTRTVDAGWVIVEPIGRDMRRVDDRGVYTEERAAFIVRACNSHDELFSLVREAREELRQIRSRDGAVYDPTLCARMDCAIERISHA